MSTKVLPITYTNTLERLNMDSKEGDTHVGIEEMSITYTQPADTNSSSDEIQAIKITTRTAASPDIDSIDSQDGYYFDVEIPEGHWSICDGDELKALIDDFKTRLYIEENRKKNDSKGND